MKMTIFKLIILLLSFFISPLSQAQEEYKLDPNHSFVLWHANHFGFSTPNGKWIVNGSVVLDEKKPTNSKVNVIIQISDLSTGIEKFDEHLLGKLFFDAEQYPTATFVSDKVTVTSKKTAKVHGLLTIRGVSQPVELQMTLNKKGVNPVNNKNTVGFTGKTSFLRSKFGMTTLIPGVSDEVKIDIEAEAYKEDSQEEKPT